MLSPSRPRANAKRCWPPRLPPALHLTELDCDLGDIQANHLLDYILKKIAPFAYNQGIEDAKTSLTSKLEDLPGTCFAEPLTYWHTPASGARQVRRKP